MILQWNHLTPKLKPSVTSILKQIQTLSTMPQEPISAFFSILISGHTSTPLLYSPGHTFFCEIAEKNFCPSSISLLTAAFTYMRHLNQWFSCITSFTMKFKKLCESRFPISQHLWSGASHHGSPVLVGHLVGSMLKSELQTLNEWMNEYDDAVQ